MVEGLCRVTTLKCRIILEERVWLGFAQLYEGCSDDLLLVRSRLCFRDVEFVR